IRLLTVAGQMLEVEVEEKKRERDEALAERVPPLKLSGLSVEELQDLCKDLHHKINVVDEERYDVGLKVTKNDKEHKETIDFKSNLKT
ncbi:unnamed protein product, partial [Coregonus sp. 'balchen']